VPHLDNETATAFDLAVTHYEIATSPFGLLATRLPRSLRSLAMTGVFSFAAFALSFSCMVFFVSLRVFVT
jgi:hypothetical protein